ncbi:MAG: hypothetical protein ACREOK_11085 [Gemmatimonadaceae bacterium]
MTDHVRVWSDELARDPSSLVFLPLAETLRRRGQLELARKVAMRGIERHPHNAEAHDQLARILADVGELEAAVEEWSVVLRLIPGHVGAIKGLAFIRFQQGELVEAERLLLEAQEQQREDGDISAAIRAIRRSGSITPVNLPIVGADTEPARIFSDILEPEHSAILLRTDGSVLAGSYVTSDGRDRARAIGATLSGISGEATRATRHLGLGTWRSIVFETEAAVVSISPSAAALNNGKAPGSGGGGHESLLMLTAPPSAPLGLLRRMLDRCIARAAIWLQARAAAGEGPA